MPRIMSALVVMSGLGLALAGAGAPLGAQPPDQGLLAFDSDRDGDWEIYLADVDGRTVGQITHNDALDGDLSWAPDGQRMAFSTDRDGDAEIYVMDWTGANPANLTMSSGAADVTPAWSPDGAQIAFASNRDGNFEIYVMNADGSGQRRLTTHPAADLRPQWSPDGRWLVFESERDGAANIYRMDAGGAGVMRLTDHPARDAYPRVSPDGMTIAFASNRDGGDDLYLMNVAGGDLRKLTDHPANDFWPVWSPDGARMAFVSTRSGDWAIFIMNADGTGLTPITDGTSKSSSPAWQSVPAALPGTPASTPETSGAVSGLGGLFGARATVESPPASPEAIFTAHATVNTGGGNNLNVRRLPGEGAPIITSLPFGTPVQITGRLPNNAWLYVRSSDGVEGWVFAALLQINIDLGAVRIVDQVVVDPPTQAPPAIPATLPPSDGSGLPVAFISFVSDRTVIDAGGCVTLRWDVEGILEVYYEGRGVVGHDAAVECPGATRTYTLSVLLPDGAWTTRQITIEVRSGY